MALNKIKNVILTPKAEGSRPKFSHMAIGSIALLFAACGDNVTEVTQVVGMQVVEEGDALPKCNAENEGQMVYSVDSAAAYYCINRKWTSMKGEDGADGKDGKDGVDGKDGKDGEDGADGKNGKDGKNGTNGSNGKDGDDGLSCTAEAIDDGYKIVCGDDSVGVVLNGAKGDKGVDGADGKSFVDGWMIDPRDKQPYRVVTIGEQTWMAENLNFATRGSYCYGETESDPRTEFCTKYGRLYTWEAALGKNDWRCSYYRNCDVRGICPEGWHLPDTTEWKTLLTAVGGISTAGNVLRASDGWYRAADGSDDFGFSAHPGGGRNSEGRFFDEYWVAHFWSITEHGSDDAYLLYLTVSSDSASLPYISKDYALSVRCIKD